MTASKAERPGSPGDLCPAKKQFTCRAKSAMVIVLLGEPDEG